MNCCKTVVIVDNKRGPQGGINDEARAALQHIDNQVVHVDNQVQESKNQAAIAAQKAIEAGNSAANASNSARQAEIFANAAAIAASLYEENKVYYPPDMVVVNGETYRCVQPSHGEYPPTSSKWILLATVAYETFELDENSDLMPMLIPQASLQWSMDENGDIMPAS